MSVKSVGILSPGDMGGKVGAALAQSGFHILTCLHGRSERTKKLAAEAGFQDTDSLKELVTLCDLLLSILVPDAAPDVADAVADAIKITGKELVFADCNAISPNTVMEMHNVITNAGGKFIDVGIIGAPPSVIDGNTPRFYASGEHAHILGELDGKGITVPIIGGGPGKASGLKMCYASLTKGTAALHTAALVVAERMEMYKELIRELEFSQSGMLRKMESVNGLSAKAFRWVGEMEEIANTFEAVGVTPMLHKGAADVFRMIADSHIGEERPETIDKSRTLNDTVRIFADSLDEE